MKYLDHADREAFQKLITAFLTNTDIRRREGNGGTMECPSSRTNRDINISPSCMDKMQELHGKCKSGIDRGELLMAAIRTNARKDFILLIGFARKTRRISGSEWGKEPLWRSINNFDKLAAEAEYGRKDLAHRSAKLFGYPPARFKHRRIFMGEI